MRRMVRNMMAVIDRGIDLLAEEVCERSYQLLRRTLLSRRRDPQPE
jgi:hypothetical protein